MIVPLALDRARTEPEASAYRVLSRANKLHVALARYRQAVVRQAPLESAGAGTHDALAADAF